MVKFLLESGADVNASVPELRFWGPRFGEIFTALRAAAKEGDLETTHVLLEAGADPNLGNPLFDAVYNNDRDIVQLLIKYGALIERPYTYTMSEDPIQQNLAELHSKHGASSKKPYPKPKKDDRVVSTLVDACRHGTLEMVQLLIDEGAHVNARDHSGNTALIYAVLLGLEEISMALIDKGADVNASNAEGCTALTYSVLLGLDGITMALLRNGADRIQTDMLLQDPIKRAGVTHTLQDDCQYSVRSGQRPLYYGTSVCTNCDYKPGCDEELSKVQSKTP